MSKNIWILNHYASDMYVNEGGRHHWFAKYLANEGHKVTVVCANTLHSKNFNVDMEGLSIKHQRVEDFDYIFIKTTDGKGNGIKRVFNMYNFYRNTLKKHNRIIEIAGKPDIIYASSVHPLTLLAGIKIGKRLKIPVISEVRDLWPEAIFQFGKTSEKSILGKLLVRGERYLYENSDAIIFTKEGDKDYLYEQGWMLDQGGKLSEDKLFYINNGVDLISYNKTKNNYHFDNESLNNDYFNVVYAGAIRPVNNVENIIDAAKLIKENNIRFHIFGDGMNLNSIKEKVREENINNVIIYGGVEKKYIPDILSKSNLNILNYSTTLYNWSRGNSSNKLFEYLASGKPIISNVKMGYSIIKRYNCGVELELDDPAHLASSILYFYNLDYESYESYCQNSLIASENFSYEKLTQELLKVFNYLEKTSNAKQGKMHV